MGRKFLIWHGPYPGQSGMKFSDGRQHIIRGAKVFGWREGGFW